MNFSVQQQQIHYIFHIIFYVQSLVNHNKNHKNYLYICHVLLLLELRRAFEIYWEFFVEVRGANFTDFALIPLQTP